MEWRDMQRIPFGSIDHQPVYEVGPLNPDGQGAFLRELCDRKELPIFLREHVDHRVFWRVKSALQWLINDLSKQADHPWNYKNPSEEVYAKYEAYRNERLRLENRNKNLVDSIKELSALSDDQLLKISGIGPKTLRSIRRIAYYA